MVKIKVLKKYVKPQGQDHRVKNVTTQENLKFQTHLRIGRMTHNKQNVQYLCVTSL